ncbi:MAG: hypothetical protein KAG56_04025, partial [Sulfurovaceae bacterium]|nr:hypothetical protein [Sulfurovaceae bacterium]
DWQKILENPQTYHNLKLKLSTNTKTSQELLVERDKLFLRLHPFSVEFLWLKIITYLKFDFSFFP